ncbi:MAG TPA: zinc-binding dehydrogenase [Bdellovibrionales bacterium]|nr:zinc-binding dehydrogenase [Bdellovibrionales bacterium]
MGEIKKGDTVVVFGAGPVGIFAAKSAQLMGAGRVMIVDGYDYRLEFAQKFTGAEPVNFRELDDPVMFFKKTTDHLGPDVCIEAVGAEADGSFLQRLTGVKMKLQAGAATALYWAIDSVRKGGVISIVGVFGPTSNMVPIGNVVNKGLTIRANQASVRRNVPKLFEHIEAGHVSPKDVLTHRIPLEEISDAYHLFSSKLDNIIKPVLIPPSVRH